MVGDVVVCFHLMGVCRCVHLQALLICEGDISLCGHYVAVGCEDGYSDA